MRGLRRPDGTPCLHDPCRHQLDGLYVVCPAMRQHGSRWYVGGNEFVEMAGLSMGFFIWGVFWRGYWAFLTYPRRAVSFGFGSSLAGTCGGS